MGWFGTVQGFIQKRSLINISRIEIIRKGSDQTLLFLFHVIQQWKHDISDVFTRVKIHRHRPKDRTLDKHLRAGRNSGGHPGLLPPRHRCL